MNGERARREIEREHLPHQTAAACCEGPSHIHTSLMSLYFPDICIGALVDAFSQLCGAFFPDTFSSRFKRRNDTKTETPRFLCHILKSGGVFQLKHRPVFRNKCYVARSEGGKVSPQPTCCSLLVSATLLCFTTERHRKDVRDACHKITPNTTVLLH